MTGSILYMGDTSLEGAAAYLAGVISLRGWEFEYVPSDENLSKTALAPPWSLFILSDYPAQRIPDPLQREIIRRVESGAGLLMIGGWESFHGLGGDWDGTPIGEVLPVTIESSDDRLNCDHPVLVRRAAAHPTTDALPWDERPPLVGGLNRVRAKPDGVTLLTAEHFHAGFVDDTAEFAPTASDPLLVVGAHGGGRTAAFMSDVAPHWVGPLVDWGPERVRAEAPGAEPVEVGNLYARFLQQLLTWVLAQTT